MSFVRTRHRHQRDRLRRAAFAAAIIATCPILMAALGGLWSERAGVVNIGLEGQMILGTWGAGYFTYYYGPWAGIERAPLSLGALGGLIHAVATVTWRRPHVSGVAVNIIGTGAASSSPRRPTSPTSTANVALEESSQSSPVLEKPGQLHDSRRCRTDWVNLTDKQTWFLVSDIASLLGSTHHEDVVGDRAGRPPSVVADRLARAVADHVRSEAPVRRREPLCRREPRRSTSSCTSTSLSSSPGAMAGHRRCLSRARGLQRLL